MEAATYMQELTSEFQTEIPGEVSMCGRVKQKAELLFQGCKNLFLNASAEVWVLETCGRVHKALQAVRNGRVKAKGQVTFVLLFQNPSSTGLQIGQLIWFAIRDEIPGKFYAFEGLTGVNFYEQYAQCEKL